MNTFAALWCHGVPPFPRPETEVNRKVRSVLSEMALVEVLLPLLKLLVEMAVWAVCIYITLYATVFHVLGRLEAELEHSGVHVRVFERLHKTELKKGKNGSSVASVVVGKTGLDPLVMKMSMPVVGATREDVRR